MAGRAAPAPPRLAAEPFLAPLIQGRHARKKFGGFSPLTGPVLGPGSEFSEAVSKIVNGPYGWKTTR
jgi:hypothetical protein